jgi:disulfide bond formation protein DsbB
MKILMFLLVTLLGTIGWYAGESLGGIGYALLVSTVGSILGVYLAWKIAH